MTQQFVLELISQQVKTISNLKRVLINLEETWYNLKTWILNFNF